MNEIHWESRLHTWNHTPHFPEVNHTIFLGVFSPSVLFVPCGLACLVSQSIAPTDVVSACSDPVVWLVFPGPRANSATP
jgi:hypothetical protein